MMEEIDRRLALWERTWKDMDIAITLLRKLHEFADGKGFSKARLHVEIDEIIQHLAESKWRNE